MSERGPFLTREEVKAYTHAGTRAGAFRVLREAGIRHIIGADGWPSVTWAAVDGVAAQAQPAQSWKPRKAA